jgi:5-methylcytosine-specific restriction endonuclease McrA
MEDNKRVSIKQSLRYAILQRDVFACCICGRNAREDKVKLEVDHRISVVNGGTNHPNNLWTLCFDTTAPAPAGGGDWRDG